MKRFIETHTSPFRLLVVQASLVGILTALVWVIFAGAIDLVIQWREIIVSPGYILPVRVAIATLISGTMVAVAMILCRRFAPETLGGGIAFMEGVLDGFFPIRPKRILGVKGISSLLILASGMPLGPEGPIVQMGGAMGALIAQIYRVSADRGKILASAGIGAAMAAAFNAPLGGILVVMEEFRPEFENRIEAWHSMIFSVVGATIVTRFIFGTAPVFSVERFTTPSFYSLWIFALLGILVGIVGYWFNRLFFWFSDLLSHLPWSAVILGGFIGSFTVLTPVLTGDGFDLITREFDNHQRGWMLLLIFAARFLLTILCGASGAPGGLYMPLLALATIFSLGFAREMHFFFPGFLPHPEILAIAGTAALISATSRTPLAAIVITVEITDNYELLLSMLVCSLFSLVTAEKLGGEPIFSVLLRRSLN